MDMYMFTREMTESIEFFGFIRKEKFKIQNTISH